jgi:hypothetical protein
MTNAMFSPVTESVPPIQAATRCSSRLIAQAGCKGAKTLPCEDVDKLALLWSGDPQVVSRSIHRNAPFRASQSATALGFDLATDVSSIRNRTAVVTFVALWDK